MRRIEERFAAIPAAVPEQCRSVRAMRLFVEVAYNVGRDARLGSFPSRADATSAWCLVMLICVISASLLVEGGCWWRGLDSNQRRRAPTDLQSVPFSLSGTPPRGTAPLGPTGGIVNEAATRHTAFMSDLPAYVQLRDLVQISSVAFVLACLSTIYPAWRAARLLPAESLRND